MQAGMLRRQLKATCLSELSGADTSKYAFAYIKPRNSNTSFKTHTQPLQSLSHRAPCPGRSRV